MERLSPILIAYDGSEHARQAIAHAGDLFPGRPALVLYAWELVELAAIRRGAIGLSTTATEETVDAAAEATARRVASEGAELARQAGLEANPWIVRAADSVWETIVQAADEADAALIVLGSRGLRGLRSLVLGSVAQQVVHHAHRPVLVVPAAELAAARRRLAAERSAGIGAV